jgi:hypothetical protein
MSHNVEVVIQESLDVNLITQMWLKIQSSPLLVLKPNEYIRVVEIVMVQVLGLVEDKELLTT